MITGKHLGRGEGGGAVCDTVTVSGISGRSLSDSLSESEHHLDF